MYWQDETDNMFIWPNMSFYSETAAACLVPALQIDTTI